jgi:hypothetical protein
MVNHVRYGDRDGSMPSGQGCHGSGSPSRTARTALQKQVSKTTPFLDSFRVTAV